MTNLCPCFYRQFRDFNSGRIKDGDLSTIQVLVIHHLLNCASEVFIIWKLWEEKQALSFCTANHPTWQISGNHPDHGQRFLAVEHTVDVADDLTNVVVWNLAGPTCADAFGSVHKHSGDDGNVPFRLYALVVIIVILEQVVIHCWENKAGEGARSKDWWENFR